VGPLATAGKPTTSSRPAPKEDRSARLPSSARLLSTRWAFPNEEDTVLNENIRRLVRLQDISIESRNLEALKKAIPERIAALANEFTEKMEEIGSDRLRHQTLEEERTQLRQQESDLNQRLEQAQQKLMQVTNQREYSAVLNEIDTTKAQLVKIAEEIGKRDVEIEALAGPAAEADDRIAEERSRVEALKEQINDELTRSTARLAELQAQSEKLRAEVDKDYLLFFDRMFHARGGVAVAAVKRDACGACQMKLRPQLVHLARLGREIVRCDSCKRLLYVPEVVQSAPAGDDSGQTGPGATSGNTPSVPPSGMESRPAQAGS